MKKKLVYLLLLIIGATGYSQRCPQLITPTAGATDVPVETIISWEEIPGVPGYFISLGTMPGAEDILSDEFVGSATSYIPPVGLPEDTQIFVTITLFFFDPDFDNIVCSSIPFTTERITDPPECTTLRRPLDNDIDVNIESNISWNYAPGATSYILTITPLGGPDIVNMNVGNVLTFNPPGDLPTLTEIFVQVTPVNDVGNAMGCSVESFITSDVVLLPECTTLISPVNGETNVPLTPILQWEPVPGAEGYLVSIGTSPFENNIAQNAIFRQRTSTPVLDFDPNRTIFITIIPFNDSGEALGCTQESFSTAEGCGPFLDRTTGELIDLFPELDFPDSVSICENALPTTLSTDATAEAFRWVRTTQAGTVIEELSDTREAEVSQAGFYRLEIFNFADPNGNNIPCPAIQEFTVIVIPGPTINSVDVERQGDSLRLSVNISGTSDYEYALNSEEGPYQDSNVFDNVPIGNNTVFVRDKNELECIVSQLVEQDLISEGFPNFFTPNGDGINDFWQFSPPPNAAAFDLATIFIFNRFGQLIVQINPNSQGWNGTFNGRPLPSSNYWFRALGADNSEFHGHFALKR
ncbi:MAG: T9SS type B sorting domain-containing protein [Saonia sp.]